ncbi:HAD-IA family hydrolase [Streptomyces stelliscabiei]|uniref:Sugar-phosphatase n=1 Tax=Streptomyces stelliscabiei TaxID=146820 RepID=A0A8I0P5X0_9ACTN|nr:HAD-IA family hydrolase [Streptomyces stelliscabiei]KND44995.1 HAD family hydrolase [Streptomyces stelliscabiei]MBE1596806.1 sugar-phosphatase [Streptomyces stelliscabiei]MDX2514737.1 HAD-IA family hydrolase [Streptomyces stelliscabiei]MDX2551309.1 HAD-IA family hydrolase [Streptomyces stelliscabiei]MDX2614935.1 HAD-IA family hydrolase [Streptomyces stelliscabiei]
MTATTVLTARALLLDMDGTLVNSDAAVERVWRRWAERHGLDGTEIMKVVHGRQGYATMAVLLPDRPMAENLAENARMLAEETADVDGVVPIPGAPEFLAALVAGGVPHALVTSADVPLSTARMAAAGLPLPELRVTAESVGASKPDPEGFLKGAAELGIAPEDCVVFEDSEAGIAAGRAAGMRVVGIGERARSHGPDVVAPDLTAVRVEVAGDGAVRLHVRG